MQYNKDKTVEFLKKHKRTILFTLGSIGSVWAGASIIKVACAEPQKYSDKWFESASNELLTLERENVRKQFCSAGDNYTLAIRLEKLLHRFDNAEQGRLTCKIGGFPVHREHGWYLSNDD